MSYPTDIPALQDALFAYVPPEGDDALAAVVEEAQSARSVVVAAVAFFKFAKDYQELDTPGLRILLGAAHLIAANGWHKLAAEAVGVVSARVRELPPPDPDPEEVAA